MKTNIEVITELMERSRFGALAQMFVIDALTKHARAVAAADPAEIENSFISGKAWVGVAQEIRDKLNVAYPTSVGN